MAEIKITIKKHGMFNLGILIPIVILWLGCIWVHGLFGAVSWVMLKLIFPIVGFIGLIVFGVLSIVLTSKRKKIASCCISFLLSIVLVFPILITMNIIPLAYPIDIDKTSPAIVIVSPLTENAVIGWGGDSIENNLPHAMWASERWAYDLVMEPYDTGSANLEDYGIWDKEVISPVAGTVVAVYDDESDIPPNTEEFITAEGNHVYIQIEETGTYLLLNHIKKDSVTVAVGDKVAVGDLIARVGNSGSTSEPHLHIHHQRQNPLKIWFPVFAEGLPLYFETESQHYMPIRGSILVYNHAEYSIQ